MTASVTSSQSSGRYQYKYWGKSPSGERIAVLRSQAGECHAPPDLINTAYRNRDGVRVVYGLVFDLDVERARESWQDHEGKLDWSRMRREVQKKHSELAPYITHAVRSTGGRGLALVVAINPLPLIASTQHNQEVASNLQARLIQLFIDLGFGADPSARGLERDFPNFNDASRCLHRDQLMQRRIERERLPVVTLLHTYLNKVDAEIRARARIYRDARVEDGLARLVGWLLGAFAPEASLGLRTPLFLSGDEKEVSLADLRKLTGLSDRFLRKFLKNPPEWLISAQVSRGEWRVAIPLSEHIPGLLERLDALSLKSPCGTKKTSFNPAHLLRPELVQDGERNHWLTLLALAYKWAGCAQETALRKIELRMRAIPDVESSRNCRQVKAIVKSIFRNMPETFGMFHYRDLPPWATDDNYYENHAKVVSPRRGRAPGLSEAGIFGSQKERPLSLSPAALCGESPFSDTPIGKGDVVPVLFLVENEISHNDSSLGGRVGSGDAEPQSGRGIKSLVAIRRRQRVGIFDGERLIVCVTRRHYVASHLLKRLQEHPEYSSFALKIHSPHRDRQGPYYRAIDACDSPTPADIFCGKRETKERRLSVWRERKGKVLPDSRENDFEESALQEVPF